MTQEKPRKSNSWLVPLIAVVAIAAIVAIFFATRPKAPEQAAPATGAEASTAAEQSTSPEAGEASQAGQAAAVQLEVGAAQSTSEPDAATTSQADGRAPTGLTMQAQQGVSTLDITRAAPGGTEPANVAKDSWTVFVYMCGSDLESQSAAASIDLQEMLNGKSSANVKYVIETGGARTWQNNLMRANQLGRYVIQGGQIQDASAIAPANMGEASTLSNFLTWGIKNFPADHMALILWDHGGGSISGVCFDEINRKDSLYLRELDTALNASFASMWEKFEFIGFDACLMSTLEAANVLASYANYMVASQESEPGGGWEYSSITKYLSQNPSTGGDQLGKFICDSYHASVDRNIKGFVTLSVVDLSKIDQLMQDYYAFSQEMYESGSNQANLTAMTRAINQADNFGANNRQEGFTNMVDLGGLVNACASLVPSASKVQASINNAVTYQINGTYHADSSGLSTYYPLAINNKTELSIFETVAVNPSYLSYIDRLVHGATYNGGAQYQQYSSDSIWGGNFWNWLLGNATEVQQQTQQHWDYVDQHEPTSTQISFEQQPQVDEEGTFWFKLDEKGKANTAMVYGGVWQRGNNDNELIDLGETWDIYGDWDNGQFADGFDGRWLSLPDGQNLALSVDDYTDDYIIYTSPIELNGTECYLRMRQDILTGDVEVEGAWTGIDASGALARGLTELKAGDKIMPVYRAFSTVEGQDAKDYEGEVYTIDSDTLEIVYDYLPEGSYYYSFYLQDAFGDTYRTAAAQFEVDEMGDIYYL